MELSLGHSCSLFYWTGPVSGTESPAEAPRSGLRRGGDNAGPWQSWLLEGWGPKERSTSDLSSPYHFPGVCLSLCPREGNFPGVDLTPPLLHCVSVSVSLCPPVSPSESITGQSGRFHPILSLRLSLSYGSCVQGLSLQLNVCALLGAPHAPAQHFRSLSVLPLQGPLGSLSQWPLSSSGLIWHSSLSSYVSLSSAPGWV